MRQGSEIAIHPFRKPAAALLSGGKYLNRTAGTLNAGHRPYPFLSRQTKTGPGPIPGKTTAGDAQELCRSCVRLVQDMV